MGETELGDASDSFDVVLLRRFLMSRIDRRDLELMDPVELKRLVRESRFTELFSLRGLQDEGGDFVMAGVLGDEEGVESS